MYIMETKSGPPESNSNKSGPCVICGSLANNRCSGCENGPYYCGKEHQIQDWKAEHRTICSGVKSVLDPLDGTTVLHKTTRALKTGHVIFKRSPIVVFPRQLNQVELPSVCSAKDYYGAWGPNAHEVMMPCLGCCQIIPYNNVTRDPIRGYCPNFCSHCEWPIHDEDCERIHKVECDFLKSNNVKLSKHPRIFYWIGFLRAVLLKKAENPDWDKLMKMPYRPGLVKETDKYEMRSFIFNDCKLSGVISPQELNKLIDLCFQNFLVCNHDLNSGRARLAFIIYKGSHGQVLTHSCSPNSYAYINKDTFQATFRTIRPVGIGETLTIDFNPRTPSFYGFPDRMNNFQSLSVKMPCRCPRCLEPTENGTYYSALRCTNKKCKDGWLTPGFSPSEQQCLWICVTCMGDPHKNERMKPGSKPLKESDVQKIVGKFRGEIARAGRDILARQKILDKNVPSIFHPNHSIVHLTLTNIAIQGTSLVSNGEQYILPSGQLNLASFFLHKTRMFEYFERVIGLNQLTQPGRDFLSANLSFYRGLLLISHLMEDISKNGKNVKMSDHADRCEKILAVITESLETLELDPVKEETRYRDDRKLSLRLYTMALEHVILQRETDEIPPVFKKLINKWLSIPDGPNTPETPAGLSLEDEIKFRVGVYNSDKQGWQYLMCNWENFQEAVSKQ